jgi:hypothetical protein
MSEITKLTGLALLLLAAGCSAHRTRVDCDGRLHPINAPAPAAVSAKPAGATSTPEPDRE